MLTKENGFTLPWRFPVPFDRKAAFACFALFITLLLVYSDSSRASGISTTSTPSSTTRTSVCDGKPG